MDAKKIFDQVAHLSRLGPYPAGLREKMAGEFERILTLFKDLSELPPPSNSLEPGILPGKSAWREDQAKPFAGARKLIANFPEMEGNLLKVPKVIE